MPALLLAALLACKPPVEAPTEMDELAHTLFRELEIEDPALLVAGVENLAPLLREAPDEGWEIGPMAADELGGIAPPAGRDPEACRGVAVVHHSPHPVEDHVPYMLLEDLTPISATAESYERTFLEGLDCFEGAGCDWLRSENAIHRSNLTMEMSFVLMEDYRWVEDAILSRNWLPDSGHGEEGANHLWQDYELEAWIPDGEGGTLRLWAMWTEAEYSGISEDAAVALGRAALVSAMQGMDDWIEGAR